ncbi:hypothetical protein C8R44DRAFT_868130 [Mycena epipterygia]|nr:hypothetical protein C8R44DRAFT_868130 [Mycena epipterygia]
MKRPRSDDDPTSHLTKTRRKDDCQESDRIVDFDALLMATLPYSRVLEWEATVVSVLRAPKRIFHRGSLTTRADLIKLHRWVSSAPRTPPLLVVEPVSLAIPSEYCFLATGMKFGWFFCNLVARAFLSDSYLMDYLWARSPSRPAQGKQRRIFVQRSLPNGDTRYEFIGEFIVDIDAGGKKFWNFPLAPEFRQAVVSRYTEAHLTSAKAQGGWVNGQYVGSVVRRYYDDRNFMPRVLLTDSYATEPLTMPWYDDDSDSE